jgi:hypothetical protein
MLDEPRRKTRYRGERCTSKLTLNIRVRRRTITIDINTESNASLSHASKQSCRKIEAAIPCVQVETAEDVYSAQRGNLFPDRQIVRETL